MNQAEMLTNELAAFGFSRLARLLHQLQQTEEEKRSAILNNSVLLYEHLVLLLADLPDNPLN